MMRRFTLPLATIAVLAPVCVGLAFYGRSSVPHLLSLRLTWLHQAQFAGAYIAEDKGFFSSEGLKVDVRPGGIDYSSVKMVSAGSDDIGLTSADQILLARSKGVPLVALAAMYQKSPVVLMSLKSSNIRRPEDLRGKIIGFKHGDNTEVPLRALLRRFGLNDGDCKMATVAYDPSPVIQGKVDVIPGLAVNEPVALRAKGYDIDVLYLADYGVNYYADVIFTREDVWKARKADVEKFLRAMLKGYQYAIDHPEEAVAATLVRNPEAMKPQQADMLAV